MEEKNIDFDDKEIRVRDLCGYACVTNELLADDDPVVVAIISKLFGDAVNDSDLSS